MRSILMDPLNNWYGKCRTIDFFPLRAHSHAGATIGLMKDSPALATHDLLREVLSDEGYQRVQTVQSLEYVWEPTASPSGSGTKLSDAYAIQLSGIPSRRGPLGVNYEGHHVSVNVTVSEGKVRGTPLFLGANAPKLLKALEKD